MLTALPAAYKHFFDDYTARLTRNKALKAGVPNVKAIVWAPLLLAFLNGLLAQCNPTPATLNRRLGKASAAVHRGVFVVPGWFKDECARGGIKGQKAVRAAWVAGVTEACEDCDGFCKACGNPDGFDE